MKFIIGGAYQGKKEQACKLFHLKPDDIINGTNCLLQDIIYAKAISNFHMVIRRCLEEKKDPYEFTKKVIADNPDLIVISNEIGYGIVPLDSFEREWREKCGRSCCLISEASGLVLRVVAGNVTVLKGDL